jgi:membrane protein DedA with SNARE-associated domain
MAFQHLITELTPLLQEYGYFVLALAIAVEGMGIPAPGQSLLIVASFLSVSGTMSLPLILIVAGLSAFLGNTGGYLIGAKFGHVIERKQWIKPSNMTKMHAFIAKYGIVGLLLSRFVEGIKQFICLGCGMAEMSPLRFYVGNFFAVILWLIVFGLGPALLHDQIGHILAFYHHYQLWFWCIAATIIILLIATVWYFWRRRKQQTPTEN